VKAVREIKVLYSENHTKPINTLRRQNAVLSTANAGGVSDNSENSTELIFENRSSIFNSSRENQRAGIYRHI
jgi:hypothetical protein